MTLHTALAVSALIFSVILLFAAAGRILPTIALIASGIEVALALGWLRLSVSGLPHLGVGLALAIALPGLVAWFRATAKPAISAAAVVAFVGVLQVIVLAHWL
ncbi:MAG TPA: hypothetical protein VML50_11640 [Anaeromyxobacter sp.]|nr:hypothetical protein [Anaeromyxobacter sp.]